MVCKECGAYNAEDLTHCRVCAAPLQETGEEQASMGPARRFAQAPVWPKQAFERTSGSEAAAASYRAEETQKPASAVPTAHETPFTPAAPAAPQRSAAAPEAPAPQRPAPAPEAPAPQRPIAAPIPTRPASAAAMADEVKRFCASCGKPLLPEAPFCAYCGTRVAAPIAPKAAAPVMAADLQDEESPLRGYSSRKPSKRPARAPEPKDDYDDDDDLYDDDDYDEDYEDDYEDDEDMPRAKGKGSSILFWVLIIVLVLLIGGLGMFVVNKNGGFDAVLGSLLGDKSVSTPAPVGGDEQTVPVTVDNETGIGASIKPATLQDGSEGFSISVTAPNGSRVRIITKAPLKTDSATIDKGNAITLEVPKAVFMPYDYAETDSVSVTPQIEVTTPDGQTSPLAVPAVTVTLDRLNLTISEPAALTVEQKPDNAPLTVAGVVNDHTVEVLVNDIAVPVYEGGQFQTEVVPTVDPELGGTITVTARKVNAVTTTQSITVTPYVVKDLELAVTNDKAKLRAVKGALTLDGTVTAGATVKVSSESDKVVCGETVVTANGTFSCPITLQEDGFFEVSVSGTLEGYNDAQTTCFVERIPGDSASFRKASTDISKIYGQLVNGAAKETKIVLLGTIKEIVATTPNTIVKVEVKVGKEVKEVMVCNRSVKNTLAEDDLNKRKQIAGLYAGLYPDTELPYIWGWFIWNK